MILEKFLQVVCKFFLQPGFHSLKEFASIRLNSLPFPSQMHANEGLETLPLELDVADRSWDVGLLLGPSHSLLLGEGSFNVTP